MDNPHGGTGRLARLRPRRRLLDLNLPFPSADVAVNPVVPAPVDLEADDDVIISSPRAFAEAKNNAARRTRVRTGMIDVEDLEDPPSRSKRGRGMNELVSSGVPFVNLEDVFEADPPPPPPPKEATYCCPICWDPFVEEVSTRCGHIFCRECLNGALNEQNRCPACRKRVIAREVIRVYLPDTKSL